MYCFLLILRFFKQLDAWGEDGEVLQIIMPSESEVSNLESASEKKYKSRMGNTASLKLPNISPFLLVSFVYSMSSICYHNFLYN